MSIWTQDSISEESECGHETLIDLGSNRDNTINERVSLVKFIPLSLSASPSCPVSWNQQPSSSVLLGEPNM